MNNTRTGFSVAALAVAILLLFQMIPLASAQDQDYDQDPPTRAGRLGYVQGAVSFQPQGQGDWLDAVPNRPLTTGDNLWADRDSRAEVQIGSTSLRLSSETSVTFLDLDNDVTQLRLSAGSLFFRVRHIRQGETFEVDTPNLALTVYQPGEYRLNVNENGDQTTAVVWRGDAEVTGGGSSYRLQEGQQGVFSGVEQLSYDVSGIGQRDAFDEWSRSRDDRQDRVQSSRYVSDEMTGYEDLDDYGRWHNVSGYGNVWTPVGVPYGWAPYRFGHWSYVWPWGWTWVEDEPWGFAPFHYGRWAFAGGGWCWVPGPVAVAPVYSPALVAFVGGGGFSVGVGVGGGVGWFPLGPGEVFVPWYRTSPRYVQNVNITNTRVTNVQVTNVYNNVTVNHVTNVTYVNQRVNNSVTVVNHDTFVNARSVHNNMVRVDQRQIEQARVTHDVARNIEPQRQSVIGTARQARFSPPQQVQTRQVVATREPVVRNRQPQQVGGFTRPTPPPVRTVHAAPPTQAQPLQRGARGASPGGGNAPGNAGRPGMPENNRGGAPAGAQRPGTPENGPGARPGAATTPGASENNASRPGGPANNNAGRPESPRPGADNNNAGRPESPRPGAENNNARPGAENNNARPGSPRPGAPDNTPPARGPAVPRPGAQGDNARPDAAPRPGTPDNQPGRGQMAPRPGAPDNNPASGQTPAPQDNRPSRGGPRPPSGRQDQPQGRPGDVAPQNRSNSPSARPEPTRPETPRTMPEEPARPQGRPLQPAPPDNRRESPQVESPRQSAPPDSRRDNAQPSRPAPAPRPDTRTEPAPRPEARPAEPPQQRESRQSQPPPQRESRPEPRNEKGNASEKNNNNKDNKDKKDKEPPKSKFR
jgi:hypothetical protein